MFVFENEFLDFQAIRVVSVAVNRGSDIGESLEACSRIVEGDDESWYSAWNQLAEEVGKRAYKAKTQGYLQSAETEFRKACNYYRQAGFLLHTNSKDPRILQNCRKSRECFIEGANLGSFPFEEVKIPYEQTSLPGYLFLVRENSERRPLVIIFQGFDGTAEESYFCSGEEALKRGFNVLLVDGPGQGSALREQHLHFRPDWEKVITPVVDFASQSPQVDSSRIVLYGSSFAGYLVPRALAFEKRIKLGIANGGVMDFHNLNNEEEDSIEEQLDIPKAATAINGEMEKLMKVDAKMRWYFSHGMYAFDANSPVDFLKKTRPFHLRDVVDRIETEMLVVDSEDENYFKGQSLELYDKLRCPKTFLMFKSKDGAGRHCQIGALTLSNEQIFDWIQDRI